MAHNDMRVTTRHPKNLGDDVSAEGTILYEDTDVAMACVKMPPDENLLHNEVFGEQAISGGGDKTRDECGQFRSLYHNDLNHVRIKRMSCHLQSCPSCFRVWARRIAASAAGYLWAFQEGDNERGIPRKQLAHWILSPKDEDIEQYVALDQRKAANAIWLSLDKKLRKIINTFSDFNNEVVAVVRHPSRKRCPKCKSKMKDKTSYCIPCNSPGEWYWSPHLHVITSFSYREEESSEFVNAEASLGVIFARKSFPREKNDLEDIVSYELGHALFIKGESHQAIRYLGYSSKTHFRSEIRKDKEEVSEDDPRDPNLKHVYYRVQEQMCDEIEDGVVKIKKESGRMPYYEDIYGKRVPLVRTIYTYRLTPLGRYLNNRFVRVAPAKKLKKPPIRQVWDTIGWERRFLNVA